MFAGWTDGLYGLTAEIVPCFAGAVSAKCDEFLTVDDSMGVKAPGSVKSKHFEISLTESFQYANWIK